MRIDATDEQLARLTEADTFLWDMDDTIAMHDQKLSAQVMAETLLNQVRHISHRSAAKIGQTIARLTYYGHEQSRHLEEYLGHEDRIEGFWREFTETYNNVVRPEHITFDPNTVRFIRFLQENSYDTGVISNNNDHGGGITQELLYEQTGIDFGSRVLFAERAIHRKPDPLALDFYSAVTGHTVEPERTVYVGNTVNDAVFAEKAGMQAVILDSLGNFGRTDFCDVHRPTATRAIITSSFRLINDALEDRP